ncbi:MAG TPA: hypothetical protein VG013_20955, partial [Gemmataceae bacterium]|jgi:hypothetical protein|nr:hypothetical protein [Gemmataceae bacterium]
MLNLDTHILVYALQDKLTAGERRLLARNPWSISAMMELTSTYKSCHPERSAAKKLVITQSQGAEGRTPKMRQSK